MVRKMYLTIFILFMVILIMSTSVNVNIKSVNDNLKIDVRIGFIRFVVPHQRLIRKMINDSKNKTNKEISTDLKNFFVYSRKYTKNIFKHSRLEKFYVAKYSKEDLYLNPILNGLYLISLSQFKSFLYNNFKLVDDSEIRLIKDERYDNIDYFLCLKTDFISLLTALLKGK